MTTNNGRNLFLILGNQLFNPDELLEKGCTDVYMSEDFGLCTYQKHHKLKLYLFLTSMREYKDTLIDKGINVHYNKLETLEVSKSYFDNFGAFLREHSFDKINIYEIEDKLFEEESINYFNEIEIEIEFIKSPMFLFSREELREFQGDSSKYRMANFYKKSRQRLNLLIDKIDAKDCNHHEKIKMYTSLAMSIQGLTLLMKIPQCLSEFSKYDLIKTNEISQYKIWTQWFKKGQLEGSIVQGDAAEQRNFLFGSLFYLHEWHSIKDGDSYSKIQPFIELMIDRMYSTNYNN